MTRWPVIVVLSAFCISGYLFVRQLQESPNSSKVSPRDLLEHKLSDDRGKSLEDWVKDRMALVIFGYMTCPDVCPTSLAYVAREYEYWKKEIPGIQVVFVSVDPERDKPHLLSRYVKQFHKDFVALSGSVPELKAFTRRIGGYFSKESSDSAAGYLMNHSSSFFMISRHGKLLSTFSAPQLKGALAKEVGKLVMKRG